MATRVEAVQWPDFIKFMKDYWQPGSHGAVVGPTGEGKTTLMKPILDLRKYVMVLDPKGKDDTLEKYGYLRLESLPLPRKIKKDIEEGKPVHIIIGGASDSNESDARLKVLMRQALEMARQQGGWTVFADELQVLGDREMYNLGKLVERMLITYRSKKGSVITGFQAPAWIPRSALRQIQWAILLPTRDEGMIASAAQAMGRNKDEMIELVKELPSYRGLVLTRNIHAPIMVVHPPKLG